jgi:Na+/proline symporter
MSAPIIETTSHSKLSTFGYVLIVISFLVPFFIAYASGVGSEIQGVLIRRVFGSIFFGFATFGLVMWHKPTSDQAAYRMAIGVFCIVYSSFIGISAVSTHNDAIRNVEKVRALVEGKPVAPIPDKSVPANKPMPKMLHEIHPAKQ